MNLLLLIAASNSSRFGIVKIQGEEWLVNDKGKPIYQLDGRFDWTT